MISFGELIKNEAAEDRNKELMVLLKEIRDELARVRVILEGIDRNGVRSR
jgi:hypothetical protein